MARTSASDPYLPDYWVVCLCADWCGLCRDYRDVFASMAARYPRARFAWLDIEDQADLLGDVEVETFPTLLAADAEGLRFLGPLTPQAQTLSRLLDSLERGSLQATAHGPATQQLLQALQAAPEHWVRAGR
ncbi:thioredoxin family protein [Polaromonas sp.]|uniref:thioredoxin family protein n=1 Tax=Polaromonas sp. TaxID=1869339 RepID=UPI001D3E7658|nr:thioredoxin family protein [Polaromonas sp.]MBT9474628.1 thioredoxin family protein [Polaromonas sp.]